MLKSLRVRLLFIILLALLPAVAMTAVNAWSHRRNALASAEGQLQSLTHGAASTQQQLLQSTHQLLTALVDLPAVRRTNRAACSRYLANLLTMQPQFANLALATPEGDLVCSGVPPRAPVNVSDRGYFQEVLRTREFAVGEYQVSRVTGKPGLNAAYPVLEPNGRLVGVLIAALDLNWLDQFVAHENKSQVVNLMVLDRNGTIIAHVPDGERWVGRPPTMLPSSSDLPHLLGTVVTAPGSDGTRYLHSLEAVPGAGRNGGLVVLAGIPEDEVLRRTWREERPFFILLLSGCLALAAAWAMAERLMLRPVAAITAAVSRFASGNLDVRLGPPYPAGEMGQLARTLDQTADMLQPRYDQLHALARVAVKLSRRLQPEDLLQAVCSETQHVLRADAAGVFLAEEAEHHWHMAASFGLSAEYVAGAVLSDETAQRILAPGGAVELADLNVSIPERIRAYRQEGLSAALVVPMHHDHRTIGALVAYQRDQSAWRESDKKAAVTLAEQAAAALVNARLNQELLLAYDTTLEGWARAVELRDQETEGHSRRVARDTVRLATVLDFPKGDLVHLRRGALLHDIGKLGIPDEILRKHGPLSDSEWETMRCHPLLAREFLAPIDFLQPALDIPTYHHEKWDGTGYPYGLHGEQIPWSARIFAVIDVWDALRSNRPYRKAWSEEDALAHIQAQSGAHFDPAVVAAFTPLLTGVLKRA